MHRTQVYLEDVHYQVLRAQAWREGISIAALIRRILDEYIGLQARDGEEDPLERLIGIGEGDGAAVAENVEEILYGGKD